MSLMSLENNRNWLKIGFIFTKAWNKEKLCFEVVSFLHKLETERKLCLMPPKRNLLERMPPSLILFNQLDENKVELRDHWKDLTSNYKKTMQKTERTNLNIQLNIYEV